MALDIDRKSGLIVVTGGVDLAITADDVDFIVKDTTDATFTNFIWRDHSTSKLYLGTPDAIIHTRSDILPNATAAYNLGSTSLRWNTVYANTVYAIGGLIAGDTSDYPDYEMLLDFGAAVANTWTKIVAIASPNIDYSTIGFKIEITNAKANHATIVGIDNIINETYYVACQRTLATTANDPDACEVRGPSDTVRAIKTSQGNYEIQVQNDALYREYRIRISVYASNGSHTVTYFNGGTAGTATATYTASIASNINSGDYFQNIYVDKIRITNNDDASLSSTTHGLQIGPTSGENVIIDSNEILARNNGAAASLYLNIEGTSVFFGGDFLPYGSTGTQDIGSSTRYIKNLYANGIFASASRGTSGQVLTSGGASGSMTWTTPTTGTVTGTGTDNRIALWNGTSAIDSDANIVYASGTNRLTASTDIVPGADSAYDLGTTSLRWAEIHGDNISNKYDLPNTSSSAGWWKLGTFTAGQTGQIIHIRAIGHHGYNAVESQNFELDIYFKTSNSVDVDGNGFAGDGQWYNTRKNDSYNWENSLSGQNNWTPTPVKFVANAGGTNATSYEVYVWLPTYTTNSFYTVSFSTGSTWTHTLTSTTDPGAASNTICHLTEHYHLYKYTNEIGMARALGWVPGYSCSIEKTVVWNSIEDAIELKNDADGGNTGGAVYKAIKVAAGETYDFSIQIRGYPKDNNDSAIYNATDIGFTATTITSTTTDLTAFVINDKILIRGGVNNGRVVQVSTVTSTTITIDTGSSNSLTAAAAGDTISLYDGLGLYIRVYYYAGDSLPNGKTHVSNNSSTSSPFVVEDTHSTLWSSTTVFPFLDNIPIPEDWTTFYASFTAPVDGYASIVILNWSGHGDSTDDDSPIYIKQPDIQKQNYVTATSTSNDYRIPILDTTTDTSGRHNLLKGSSGSPTFNPNDLATKLPGALYIPNNKILYFANTSAVNACLVKMASGNAFRIFAAGGNQSAFVINLNDGSNAYPTSNPAFEIRADPNNSAAALETIAFRVSHTGDVSASGDVIAYSSDKRLKTNLVPITNSLEMIDKINGYKFDWDQDKCKKVGFNPSQLSEYGVIAQEIEEIMPEIVVTAPFDRPHPEILEERDRDREDYKTVKYDKLTALLIAAVKELKAEVEELKRRK